MAYHCTLLPEKGLKITVSTELAKIWYKLIALLLFSWIQTSAAGDLQNTNPTPYEVS